MIWVIILLCLMTSFIFSGIEAGILSVNRVRLKHRVKQKDPAALKLERLLERPDRLLITVLVVTNLANIVAVMLLARWMAATLKVGVWSYLVTLVVFLPVYLIGVELLPKSLFRRFPYRALAMLAEPLRIVSVVLTPMHVVGEAVTRLLKRGDDGQQKLFVAREDFKYLTSETERAGSLSTVERQMIHGVVDFRSVTARDVMIPADKVAAIAGASDVGELIARGKASAIDRWPVTNEAGGYTGLVTLFDVALSGRRSGPVSSLQRRIVKLSPNEPAYTVLHKLRAARSVMGAVIEDGRPLGVVTWEDVILRLVKSAGEKQGAEASGAPVPPA